jgi:hypothetical protein
MNRISVSFLAGAFSVGAVSFCTEPRPSAFGFALGILTAFVTVVALIGTAKNARRVARFLNVVADGLTGSRTMTTTSGPAVAEMPSAIERDVTSALQNFGMARKAAVQLAHDTVAANPAADLQTVLNLALQSSNRKAAAR